MQVGVKWQRVFSTEYAPGRYHAISAGTKPISEVNPVAIEVMREVGIDISNQKSKEITEDMIRNSYKTINMGCIKIHVQPSF